MEILAKSNNKIILIVRCISIVVMLTGGKKFDIRVLNKDIILKDNIFSYPSRSKIFSELMV